jgi:hypothetical protein
MMTFRRVWQVTVDGVEHEVAVEYAALSGWMSIFVDGARVARAWREWQSVWGGAELSCDVAGRRLHARVAQPFGRQEYSFALSVNGVIQPGSDDLPPPRRVKRNTVIGISAMALIITAVVVLTQLLS